MLDAGRFLGTQSYSNSALLLERYLPPHLQLFDALLSRHRYWTKERQTGDPYVAEKLGKRIKFLWERDYRRALCVNDLRLG
jgi:hypothetical protein